MFDFIIYIRLINISFENSWHFAMPPMVSLQKYDFWETN